MIKKTQISSESENEYEKKSHTMNFKNRSEINRPQSFEVYVMASGFFMSDMNEPESFEEAVNCK